MVSRHAEDEVETEDCFAGANLTGQLITVVVVVVVVDSRICCCHCQVCRIDLELSTEKK